MYCPWRIPIFLFIWSLCGFAMAAGLDSNAPMANGAILDKNPCEWGPYGQQSGFTKRFYSKKDYDYAKSNPNVACLRIEYRSDGLRVVGYLVRPLNGSRSPSPSTAATRFPVIIFNRGGFLDLGKIEAFNLVDFERL